MDKCLIIIIVVVYAINVNLCYAVNRNGQRNNLDIIQNEQTEDQEPFPFIMHHIYWDWHKETKVSQDKGNNIPSQRPAIFDSSAKQKCIEMSPTFQHSSWNDKNITIFLQNHYPWFVPVFESYRYPVQKLDAAKYFLLYHFGGIYLDMDVGCRDMPMDKIFAHIHAVNGNAKVAIAETRPYGFATDMLIARAKTDFFRALIHDLTRANRNYFLPYITVMFSTGPAFFSRHVYNAPPSNINTKREYFYIMDNNDYSFMYFSHFHGNTWHEWDAKLIFGIYHCVQNIYNCPIVLFVICLLAFVFIILCFTKTPWRTRGSICYKFARCVGFK